MEKKSSNFLKVGIGIALSVILLYLAFRKIDFAQMKAAFLGANYWWLIPAIVGQLISHWIRAIRWQIFLANLKKVPVPSLFSATMIGYMGNMVLPAHLGELFRANVVGNREKISSSSVFATIVIERIVDVLSLLIVMVAVLLIYPFPDWVRTSGYLMLGGTILLFAFLVLLKQQNQKTLTLMRFFLKVLPQKLSDRIEALVMSFIDGLSGLQRKRDYFTISFLSIVIWGFYWVTLHFTFYAFNLFEIYNMNAISSLVLLVITTISVIVPSSPGYVGAYHYLCQLSLGLFGVPRPVGLSFAFVAHGVSMIPTVLIGFGFAWREGLKRLKADGD